jgi:hypothetical protein
MAKIVLTGVTVTVGAVDLSDHVAAVTISTEFDEVETTAFGQGHRTRIAGLQDTTLSLEFHQDFAATETEATLYPLLGTVATVVVKPTSAAVSATNPSYTLAALVTEWSPLDGSVGDLSTASVTWPCNSITKATSP